jgi:hypothetical protein
MGRGLVEGVFYKLGSGLCRDERGLMMIDMKMNMDSNMEIEGLPRFSNANVSSVESALSARVTLRQLPDHLVVFNFPPCLVSFVVVWCGS